MDERPNVDITHVSIDPTINSAMTRNSAALAAKIGDVRHEDNSRLERRFFRFVDRRTSISLEPEEWRMIEEIAEREDVPVKYVLMYVDRNRGNASIPSATRIFLLEYWRAIIEGRRSPLVKP